MMNPVTRRSFLTRAPAAAVAASIPTAVAVAVEMEAPPTREELIRYYTFLWREHYRLAEELGLAAFDGVTAMEEGGYAFTDRFKDAAPSTRARAVLDRLTT